MLTFCIVNLDWTHLLCRRIYKGVSARTEKMRWNEINKTVIEVNAGLNRGLVYIKHKCYEKRQKRESHRF